MTEPEVWEKRVGYFVQDLDCCETCRFVDFGYEGEIGCDRTVDGHGQSLSARGKCKHFKAREAHDG